MSGDAGLGFSFLGSPESLSALKRGDWSDPIRRPVFTNIRKLWLRFQNEHGTCLVSGCTHRPKFVALDQASYRLLNHEISLGGFSGPDSILGMEIVVIPEIPELCVVLDSPWLEARRPRSAAVAERAAPSAQDE